MTKWVIWECDRCGKELRYDAERTSRPHRLLMHEGGNPDNELTYDLCEDCLSTFGYFIQYSEEFDKLADKLCDKEAEV